MSCRIAAGIIVLLLLSPVASAASRYDPRLRFRTVTTPHFVIYYHQGEEALASRLRVLVEVVHERLTRRLHTQPRGRTHVVLVDQTDVANGFATPYPYNTVELTAVAPTAGEIIGNFDDWLTLVFTHEYTHILHLDRSEGWAGVARHVLGRSPVVFPNLYLPLWQVEGIATFEESATTGRGRVPAGDFRAIVDEAARVGHPEPLDRVNGGLIDWPAGSAHYAYGAYFHQYLAERFGEAKLADLGEATASRFPYTGSKAFEYVFGESLGALWKDFEAARTSAAREAANGETAGRRLTHRGFAARGPRFLPARDGESPELVFTVSDAHDFPSMYTVEIDGGRTRRLATRVGGDRVAVGRNRLYFDQLEVTRNVTVEGDLYAFERRDGAVRRLTHGLRATDPDLSPDGRTLACIVLRSDARALVLLDTTAPTSAAMRESIVNVASTPGVHYAAPRWSPDGRTIAAERVVRGGSSQIVLVDVASHQIHTLVDWPGSRSTSPAWMPDGRTLLFAAARGSDPFDIYAVDVASTPSLFRRVTITHSGATFPDVSPDGRTLAYVGYTTDGYDVFTMPLEQDGWRTVDAPAAVERNPSAPGPGALELRDSRPYLPLDTLLPRAWLPIIEGDEFQTRAGAQLSGADVLGRHTFNASASWWVTGERRPALQDAARPTWTASYAYDRWRPTVFAAASEIDTLYPPAREVQGRTTEILERHVSGGTIVPFIRMRHSQTMLGAVNYERDTVLSGSRIVSFERSAFRTGWAFTNAKEYGYSISSEQGVVVAATSEHVRRAIGADGDADAATADARLYARIGPRHGVAAFRGAVGVSSGDSNVRRSFDLGGSAPRLELFSFDRDSLSVLRGFDDGAFSGRRLINFNAEYRAPIRRIERGYGTWPVFARTIHGAVFADAGHTWDRSFAWRDVKTSFGAEIAIDLVGGYFVPFSITAGVARGRNGFDGTSHTHYYVRAGRAF